MNTLFNAMKRYVKITVIFTRDGSNIVSVNCKCVNRVQRDLINQGVVLFL